MPVTLAEFRISGALVMLVSVFSGGCVERAGSTHARIQAKATAANRGAVCAAIRGPGNAPIIDDFESQSPRILGNEGRSGWWFSYDDGTGGKLKRETIGVDADTGKRRALHVASSGFAKWGAGFGFNLHPESTLSHVCAYDASAYDGIRFRAKGHGRVRVALGEPSNIPPALGGACSRATHLCHDRPGVWVDLGSEWKSFEYPFCSFLPEGWGGSPEAANPSQLVGVQFRTSEREDVEVWLDDLAFYRVEAGAPKPLCSSRCPLDLVPSTAKIEPSLLMGPPAAGLSVHTFEQRTKSCGPLTRRYLSYVPSRLGPRSSAPVLIMLHGSGANAESARTFHAHNRFDALADRDGFIAVYGNAAPGSRTSPDPGFPNTGVWHQAVFDDGQVDDVDYLTKVIFDLTVRDVISGKNPVFLTGMSNGGGMVLEAVRRLPDYFRGVAAFMPYDGEQPKPVSPTRIKRLLFAYGINDPGMSDGYHEILAKQPPLWAAAMGLPAAAILAPKRSALPDIVAEGADYHGDNKVALATRHSHVTEQDMIGPDGLTQVRVLVLEHAGHFWPNPTEDTQDWVLNRWGLRNQDFDAADMVWEFLKPAASDGGSSLNR